MKVIEIFPDLKRDGASWDSQLQHPAAIEFLVTSHHLKRMWVFSMVSWFDMIRRDHLACFSLLKVKEV